MMISNWLADLPAFDQQVLSWVQRVTDDHSWEVQSAVMLSCHGMQQGHICMPLSEFAETPVSSCFPKVTEPLLFPEQGSWQKALLQNPAFGKIGDKTPFVLTEQGHLYQFRYWKYEQHLQTQLKKRLTTPLPMKQSVSALLETLFPSTTEIDWQRVAAEMALQQPIGLISGGPGTGKTSTVVKILALLQAASPTPLSIALAAPTGKAANRLQESIQQAKQRLPLTDTEKKPIPEITHTLHRLLKTKRHSSQFQHHTHNQLPYDVVVVDEASMVDLALMCKLLDALPMRSQLLLLGDQDQLASVEAGSVFSDLCSHQHLITTHGKASLQPNITMLRKSYRFDANSGIGQVCREIRDGDSNKAIATLRGSQFADLQWIPFPEAEELEQTMKPFVLEAYQTYLQQNDPGMALKSLENFRILCAVRQGPYGVERVNRDIQDWLTKERLLSGNATVPHWVAGVPIMITENDYQQNLFNGDVGVIWKHPELPKQLVAYFYEGSELRFLPLTLLPPHEAAFAMTVHKSQGSEFQHCLFLSPEAPTPIMTRELFYTAISRAKQKASIIMTESMIHSTIAQKTIRYSQYYRVVASEPKIKKPCHFDRREKSHS